MTDHPSPAPAGPHLPEIDTTVPHPARVYDYILGGTNHYPADREFGEQMFGGPEELERARGYARANRAFLGRAVRHLAGEAGIRQFLDIGTGIPSDDNVHGVAQQTAPDARIVYADNDPLVLAHAATLLNSTPEGATAYIDGDLRRTKSILLRAAATLDFNRPVAVMLIGILHMIGDGDDPYGIVNSLMAAVPPGSYLVITHMATDIEPERMARVTTAPDRVTRPVPFAVALRPRSGVARFLDGLELEEPGLVRVEEWRPDPDTDTSMTPIYAAVARKP